LDRVEEEKIVREERGWRVKDNRVWVRDKRR